jgi:hypothetical protein
MRWHVVVLGLATACGRTDYSFASAGDGTGSDSGGSEDVTIASDTDGTISVTITDTIDPSDTFDTSDVDPSATFTTFDTSDSITTFDTSDSDPSDSDTDTAGQCMTDTECESPDPCFSGTCEDGECVVVAKDDDGDGFPPPACGGDDCNDLNPNTNPAADENCFDADDNDCNGIADCLDPACIDVPNCGCQPEPGGEVCMGGQDEDCDTTVDCNDADCLGTPACGCANDEDGLCVNGFDDDCDDQIDCDDSDCAGDQACMCMGEFETCMGGEDDDCDLLIDCADPDCEGLFPCTCGGNPLPEVCDDGADNDCDDLVDCADPNCAISQACDECVPEDCDNGDDDDCDGMIDCADEACVFDPGCAPQAEICNNDLDDDGDGAIDCEDDECFGVPVCVQGQQNCGTAAAIFESGTWFGSTAGHPNNTGGSCGGGAGEAVFQLILFQPAHVVVDSIGTSFDSVLYVRTGNCGQGFEIGCDDDSGGFMWSARLDFTLLQPGNYYIFLDGYTIDPNFGPNEGDWQLNVEIVENPPEVCDDIIDNDGDVYADCGDADCVDAPGCAGCVGGSDPSAEFGVAQCTNGIDDDCDGTTDCADDDCSASDFYVTECCDGTDENDNGIPDDFNCRCNNDSECDGGQICYDHTADSCGLPCTDFFGDVCPFVAPGATCNQFTNQCEF